MNQLQQGKDLLEDITTKLRGGRLRGQLQPALLFKLFKRYVGMTPSEYKELLSRTASTQFNGNAIKHTAQATNILRSCVLGCSF
jgi:hypothetical protein